MPVLKNSRHERFAQIVARGDLSAEKSYMKAGYSKASAQSASARLLSNVMVSARVAELKGESSKDCRLSKKQVLDFLADVMITPAGNVHKAHPLCQSFKDTDQANEIRMPDKLAAATQLAKMCGWNEPDKMELTGKVDVLVKIGGNANPHA